MSPLRVSYAFQLVFILLVFLSCGGQEPIWDNANTMVPGSIILKDHDFLTVSEQGRTDEYSIVLNRKPDATERLLKFAENVKVSGKIEVKKDAWRNEELEKRIEYALVKGLTEFIDEDMAKAVEKYSPALSIIEGPLMDGMNIVGDLFAQKTKLTPDKTFLICPGKEEETYTYQELEKIILTTAAYLQSLNLQKGDRINLIMANCSEFIFLYLAGLTLGITVVPINQDLSPPEMLYIINDSQSKKVFFDSS